jgi:RNA polymerase primary sigma factor
MAEIAETLGLKRERVRQVRNQALRKLRKEARKMKNER